MSRLRKSTNYESSKFKLEENRSRTEKAGDFGVKNLFNIKTRFMN